MRTIVEIEDAVGRARRTLANFKDREEKNELEARKRAACADFGVAPTRRSVWNVRKAVSASHWVTTTGVADVIAQALVSRLPERSVDPRIESAFLVELGKTSGVKVLEAVFTEANLVPRLCDCIWPALGELQVAEGDVPLGSKIWSHLPNEVDNDPG